jgi:hypothetical protein
MSQPRTIEVRSSLSFPEFYRGNLLVCGTFEVKRVALLLVSVAFLGAMIWRFLSASENEMLAEISPIIGWVIFPVAMCGVVYGAPYLVMRRQARKEPKLLGPAEYHFSEQGVETITRFGRSEILWTGFERIRETKEFFLFYILSRRAYLLPKRCFSSNAEISEFKELLSETYRGKIELLDSRRR